MIASVLEGGKGWSVTVFTSGLCMSMVVEAVGIYRDEVSCDVACCHSVTDLKGVMRNMVMEGHKACRRKSVYSPKHGA